jgi:ABC-type uncharacterized transport system ATPase subunit
MLAVEAKAVRATVATTTGVKLVEATTTGVKQIEATTTEGKLVEATTTELKVTKFGGQSISLRKLQVWNARWVAWPWPDRGVPLIVLALF